MPDWLTLDSTLLAAVAAAIVTLAGYFLNRKSRTEEVSATANDNLLQRQGDQIKTLIDDQRWMKQRLDWLEDELWSERKHGHKLHRALGTNVDWGEEMVRWAAGDQSRPHPSPPDFVSHRELLDTPRPRRPPPMDAT